MAPPKDTDSTEVMNKKNVAFANCLGRKKYINIDKSTHEIKVMAKTVVSSKPAI
jgi:hypothetical protein